MLDRIFDRLKIANKLVHYPTLIVNVGGVDDHVVFDYGYKNGVQSYMKQVRIGRKNPWESVHAAVWSYARARQMDQNCRLVSLVTCAPNTEATGPTNLLGSASELVVVSDEDATVRGLAAALRLS